MTDGKPKWNHAIPIDTFETLIKHCITEVSHHWRMTGCDTSENWTELHYEDNGKKKTVRTPQGFDQFFKFAPDHCQLFQQTYNAERAAADLEAMRRWEKKNARDLSEYRRLKAKFEG